MKKYILLAIAVAVVGLMITSAASTPMKISTNSMTMDKPMIVEQNELQIVKSDISPYKISTQSLEVTSTPIKRSTFRAGPAFDFAGDQLHPAVGRTNGGMLMASYRDDDMANMIWTYSPDDGASWWEDGGIYWDIGGDYPSIKLWEDNTLYGTFVTDYLDLSGGATYLFHTDDPTQLDNPDVTELIFWDWSGYGWYDMMDADISCDSSENPWEWGISSYVISTTYGDGYTDGPTIVYSDEEEEGSGFISWYYYDGCAHTDVDIDPVTHMGYVVYDWEDAGTWKLLVRKIDFATIETGYDQIFEITGTGNLNKPAIAAYDDQVVILAETDENGNKDIICLYTDTGDITALQTSFVVDTVDDEQYPDIRHVSGQDFIATFVKDNNLHASETEDGGINWDDTSWQVNDNDDSVVEEYKTSDLCENAVNAMWEENGPDDIDIFIGVVLPNDPPSAPVITGETNGAAGTSYEYGFTSIDPDGDDIAEYIVDWGDDTGEEIITGPFASGVEATASHTWDEQGDYTITAKAKDINGLIGPEGTLPVTMPVNLNQQSQQQSIFIRFVQMLQNLFVH
jgi:hypothetical protein